MDDTLFSHNLRALESASPAAAAQVRASAPDGIGTATAASGKVILEDGWRALDSRRDPEAGADRAAAAAGEGPRVVLAGFGSGYLAEALVHRGLRIEAIVDRDPRVLAAAMRARDLAAVLRSTRVLFLEDLANPVALARLRRRAATVVGHPASVQGCPELAALVDRWSAIRVSGHRPRIVVAGPIYGGSLEIARSAAAACRECGADVRLLDFSSFADGRTMVERLPLPGTARDRLMEGLAELLGDAVVHVALEWKADLVFALAQAPLGPAALGRLREAGVVTAMWFVENVRVLTYWRQLAALYDWFYAIQIGRPQAELAAAGARQVRYLPLACDPERHRPVELTAGERRRFGSEVSFAGSPYLNRRRLFSALTDLPLRLWGPGWAVPPLAPHAAEGGRPFSLDEMIRVFAATRINLNLHAATHVQGLDPDADYVNPRTFELAGCGAFQLVDRRDPLPDLFAGDEIATFASLPELREAIAHYLRRDDEREAMAARARRRVLADHTYSHRMRSVLDQTLPPELAAAASDDGDAGDGGRETLEEAVARLAGTPSLESEEALTRAVFQVKQMGRALR